MSGQQINAEQVNRAGMGAIVGGGLSWWFYNTATLGQPYDDWLGAAFAIIAGVKAVQFLSAIGRVAGRKVKGDRFRKRGSGQHTSHWASKAELKRAGFLDPNGRPLGLLADGTPIFAPPRFVHHKIYATTGGGKTTAAMVPAVMSHALSDEAPSLVVSDIKDGEIAAQCAGPLIRAGIEVWVVDDVGITLHQHTSLNPFAPVVEAERDNPAMVGPAARECALVTEPEPPDDAKNKFFRDGPRNNVQFGLRTLARRSPVNCTPGGLASLIGDERLFNAALDRESLEGGALGQLADRIIERRDKGSEEHWSDFRNTALQRLEIFEEGGMLEQAGRDAAHSHTEVRERQIVVFLTAPLMRLTDMAPYLTQQLNAFMQTCKRPGRKKVVFLLDEMTNTPLPNLPSDLTVVRAYGGRVIMAVQADAEVRARYKDRARTIDGLCGLKQIMRVTNPEEAERISKALGRTTSVTENPNLNVDGLVQGSGLSDPGRPLLTSDQILTLGETEQLILCDGIRPIRCEKLFQNQIMPIATMLDPNPLEGGRMTPDPKVWLQFKR